jgi:hypothetical protein
MTSLLRSATMSDWHERIYALSESAEQIGIVTVSLCAPAIVSAYDRFAWVARLADRRENRPARV